MKTPKSIAREAVSTPHPSPSIRIVHAFRDAAESSKPQGDPLEEAFSLEHLMIAGDSSFMALSRLQDFLHEVAYGGDESFGSMDLRIVEDGYQVWLNASDLLIERVVKLEETRYESESFAKFRKDRAEALEFLEEARERRKLERQALRTDQLAHLASKLNPLQAERGDRRTVG